MSVAPARFAAAIVLTIGFALAPASAAEQPATKPATAPAEPAWAAPMRKVHAARKPATNPADDAPAAGVYVAQLGDSITYSMAFWAPLAADDPDKYLSDDGLPKRPADNARWPDLIRGFRDKGEQHGNYSGWRTANVLKAIDGVLAAKRPQIALVMVGTNDVTSGRVPDGYRADLEKIVDACTAAGCVPVLNTIPPRKGLEPAVDEANKVIRAVAEQRAVPLVDYNAEIMRRFPGRSWWKTLIDADGVHPTAPAPGDFSEENINRSGYALRTWMNFLAVRDVYFFVIAKK